MVRQPEKSTGLTKDLFLARLSTGFGLKIGKMRPATDRERTRGQYNGREAEVIHRCLDLFNELGQINQRDHPEGMAPQRTSSNASARRSGVPYGSGLGLSESVRR